MPDNLLGRVCLSWNALGCIGMHLKALRKQGLAVSRNVLGFSKILEVYGKVFGC